MAASAASHATSNTFPHLLRRAKISSWDPVIEQVYTTPKQTGHYARLDFGLKRALPGRVRRTPFIRIRDVDSAFKYTDWEGAGKGTKFVARWDESGLGAQAEWRRDDDSSSFRDERNPSKSWFDPEPTEYEIQSRDTLPLPKSAYERVPPSEKRAAKSDSGFYRVGTVPNFMAMSEREFLKFLAEIRDLRPEFERFLKLRRFENKVDKARNDHRKEVRAELAEIDRAKAKAQKAGQDVSQFDELASKVLSKKVNLPSFEECHVDLYSEAQSNQVHLAQQLEQFLAWITNPPAPSELPDEEQGVSSIPETPKEWRLPRHGSGPIVNLPHRSLGLTYSPKNTFFHQYLSDPIPARLIARADRDKSAGNRMVPQATDVFAAISTTGGGGGGGGQAVAQGTVMGQIVPFVPNRLPYEIESENQYTQFYEDGDGRVNDRGKIKVKVEDTKVFVPSRRLPGLVSANVGSATDPLNTRGQKHAVWNEPREAVSERLNVQMWAQPVPESHSYTEQGQSEGRFERRKVGSRDYVGTEIEDKRRTAPRTASEMAGFGRNPFGRGKRMGKNGDGSGGDDGSSGRSSAPERTFKTLEDLLG